MKMMIGILMVVWLMLPNVFGQVLRMERGPKYFRDNPLLLTLQMPPLKRPNFSSPYGALFIGEFSTNGINWEVFGNILSIGTVTTNMTSEAKLLVPKRGIYRAEPLDMRLDRLTYLVTAWGSVSNYQITPMALFRVRFLSSTNWF